MRHTAAYFTLNKTVEMLSSWAKTSLNEYVTYTLALNIFRYMHCIIQDSIYSIHASPQKLSSYVYNYNCTY